VSRPLAVAIRGIGLLGPGLDGWAAGAALLRTSADWVRRPTAVPAPTRLPATERRRAGAVVRASIVVAEEAVAAAGLDASTLPTVFTSSTGEPANCHALCEALAAPERAVSPTRFTNSVHNAPAGYWHIATKSMQPSTSLAAFDASFGAGLLEAAAQCVAGGRPVLLVACDVPYPEPLHAVRPVADVFGVALVVVPAGAGGTPLALTAVAETAPTTCGGAALEALRQAVPAARALPLLQALACGEGRRVVLDACPGLALQADVG
jgi:hypothetical protein